jgi:hypothetical protein
MAKRKAYAPFSLTSEAGVAQTPVEGYIDVEQKIYPTVATGTINENGTWSGVKSDDGDFIGFTKAEGIAGSGTVLFPDTNNFPSIDMTGFRHLQFAFKSTSNNAISINAVMGPDTTAFANLKGVAAAVDLKFISDSRYIDEAFDNVLNDTSESMSANEWRLFTILNRAQGQKNLQILATNTGGSNIDLEFAFRRLV